jgi:cyclic beta-1,2-glucan synthetase
MGSFVTQAEANVQYHTVFRECLLKESKPCEIQIYPNSKRGGRNRIGAGLDPCGVLQAQLRLEPNGADEIVFFLGETGTAAEALSLITRYRTVDLDLIFDAVIRQWDVILGAVQVKTLERSTDILMNRWVLYQTLACRVWARSAFYQAGGAYGFRDQLQDVMALITSKPETTREHLLRAVRRGRRTTLVATIDR